MWETIWSLMVNSEKDQQRQRDKLHTVTNNREWSQEIMSHGPIMFSDFTGFGTDFPFILLLSTSLSILYTPHQGCYTETVQHLPRLCTIVTAHFFNCFVYILIFSKNKKKSSIKGSTKPTSNITTINLKQKHLKGYKTILSQLCSVSLSCLV